MCSDSMKQQDTEGTHSNFKETEREKDRHIYIYFTACRRLFIGDILS